MQSKSSPFAQNKGLQEQIEYAVKLFKPIQGRILGAVDGNHELRIKNFCDFSPTTAICGALGVGYYNNSVVYHLVVGTGKAIRGNRQGKVSYWLYAHHTTGGGGSVGGKINRVDKLRQLVANCDAYIGSHNHQLGVLPVETRVVDISKAKLLTIRQLLIDTGSYLGWDDGYAEEKQLQPSKQGSPRIRLSGIKKDIHCSV